MGIFYTPSLGRLALDGIEKATLSAIMKDLGLIGTSSVVKHIVISGTASLKITPLDDSVELFQHLTISLSGKGQLHMSSTAVLSKVRVTMTGLSTLYIYNRINMASFNLAGRAKCTISANVPHFEVLHILPTVSLVVGGETITRTVCRIPSPTADRFTLQTYKEHDVDAFQYSISSSSGSLDDWDEEERRFIQKAADNKKKQKPNKNPRPSTAAKITRVAPIKLKKKKSHM